MKRPASGDHARVLRRLRRLVSDALGTAIAARWAAGQLDGGEPVEREELRLALLRAEDALHDASARLLRIQEAGEHPGNAP